MIIIASTVEYYLSTMQKYPTLAFSGSHQQMMLRRHPWTYHFMIFWCFGAFFWHTWWRHQYVLRAKVLKLFVLKTFVSSAENLTSIGRQMHSKQPLIPVRGQNILCWKLDPGCHFGSNGPIYFFKFYFLVHHFCVLFFCCYCCFVLFLGEKGFF